MMNVFGMTTSSQGNSSARFFVPSATLRDGYATGKGVRILPFLLPTQSPWLNPIEPKWVHGKRHVVEVNGLLTAKQLAERICAYYGTSYEAHLSIPEQVA
jgi:hypothetical protein